MAITPSSSIRSLISLADSLDSLRGWFNAHVTQPRIIGIQSAT